MIPDSAADAKTHAAGSVSKSPPQGWAIRKVAASAQSAKSADNASAPDSATQRNQPAAPTPAQPVAISKPSAKAASSSALPKPAVGTDDIAPVKPRGWASMTSQVAPLLRTQQLICGDLTLRLAAADLKRSTLTTEQAQAGGLHVVEDASETNPDFAPKPGIIFPYFDAHRRPFTYDCEGIPQPFCRVRYLTAPGFPLPKNRRYDQPAESGTPPYFPLCFDWQRVLSGEVNAIAGVEGEKKAIAMCEAGIPTFAIGGVWNFADGGAALHPALAEVFSKCEDLYIVFDSDIATNPKVQQAEWRLMGQAAQFGCRVHPVRLPPSAELDDGGKPKKVGADDFLAAHDAPALKKLILETPTLGEHLATSAEQIPVADILRRQITPVEELIPGWIEKNIPNFLCGAGGVHKSRLAMQWGLCLTAGATVWGLGASLAAMHKPKATLVYVAAEDDANELARRAQGICSALKIKPPSQGVFVPRCGKDSALVLMHESSETEFRPFYFEMLAMLRAIPGHKVVVLDSAYDFVRFMGKAKIDEDSVNYFIKVVLQGICDQCDATLIIPWHPSQAGSERETMDGWSVAWNNSPRNRLSLKAVKNIPDTYELSVAKRNHGRKGDPIQLRYCDGALLPLNALPDDGKAGAFHQAVVNAAITAARANVPCNRRYINDGVFAEGKKVLGRRPARTDIYRELENAAEIGELIFVKDSSKRASGFYPPDKEEAVALSLSARRAGKPTSGDGGDA